MKDIVIIGAGISGLSLGYFLKQNCVILEKESRPGGLCRSVHSGGYTFDYSGHFLHFRDESVKQLAHALLSDKLEKIKRNAWIYTNSVYVPFPFQSNLSYLPEKIREKCLKGFLNRPECDTRSFYGWSVATFGKGITEYFMRPYNEKLWTTSSKTLSSGWVAPFVPVPASDEIKNGISPDKAIGYNAYFYYPEKGGIGALSDAFYKNAGDVRTGVKCGLIDLKSRAVQGSDGKKLPYKTLVSTQPLVELLQNIKDLPGNIRAAGEKLRWNSVTCFNIGVRPREQNKALAEGRHWIYYPENKYPFYRAGFYGNIAASSCPAESASIYIEASRRPGQKVNTTKLLKDSLRALESAGILKAGDKIEAVAELDMPFAYVIYDANRKKALETIMPFLEKKNIYSIGRYGAWEYSFMEKSILDAKLTAEKIKEK